MKKNVRLMIFIFLLMIVSFFLIIIFYNKSKDKDLEDTRNSSIEEYLLSTIRYKACCREIGGTVSEKNCKFSDLNGKELTIKLEEIENYNGINYCTDEYFDRK